MERRLIVGYQSAVDYWRATRVASPDKDESEFGSKVIGALPLTSAEQVARDESVLCGGASRCCVPHSFRQAQQQARGQPFVEGSADARPDACAWQRNRGLSYARGVFAVGNRS